MIKKILKIMIFLLFVILGISLIRIGFYFEKLSQPKNIYKSGIDIITAKLKDITSIDEKYILGDDFSLNGKITVNTSSELYPKKILIDPNYIKKYNLVNNFNKMNIDYEIIQNKKDKKLFLSINEKNPKKNILNYKMLVENSTEYYFVGDIINNYINDGSNNYFEMFTEDKTALSNIDYMYEFLSLSLAKELGEEAEKYKKTTTYNNKKEELNQVSVKLTNKTINKIISAVIEDIKNDKEANKIMNSIDSNFKNRKIKEKKYLDKNESYTINIYCSKYLNKPLKYEIIYTNDKTTKTYSYEGNKDKGLFYYAENDNLKYSADYKATNKTIDVKVYDQYQKNTGTIKLNKDKNNVLLNVSLNLDDKSYDIIYSNKYKNYKKNNSYDINTNLSFKILENNQIKLSGDIIGDININKNTTISQSVENAILTSKLTEEQKNKFDNIYDNVKRRLENE